MTTGIPGGLPDWRHAMAAAARHLIDAEAWAARNPKHLGSEQRAQLAEAWIAYARELTAHEQAGPPPLR